MSHLTFATTAQGPDFVYRTVNAQYQVSREAFIECVEARCAAAEARTTGVWAEDCLPDVKAESQRRVSELRQFRRTPCGRGPESLQLMRKSLGTHSFIVQ
jgi:hypothetical protein